MNKHFRPNVCTMCTCEKVQRPNRRNAGQSRRRTRKRTNEKKVIKYFYFISSLNEIIQFPWNLCSVYFSSFIFFLPLSHTFWRHVRNAIIFSPLLFSLLVLKIGRCENDRERTSRSIKKKLNRTTDSRTHKYSNRF